MDPIIVNVDESGVQSISGVEGRRVIIRDYTRGNAPDAHGDLYVDEVLQEGEGGRETLVHLNVAVPDGDSRTADEIADALLAAIEVGSDNEAVRDLKVVCPLAEDIS